MWRWQLCSLKKSPGDWLLSKFNFSKLSSTCLQSSKVQPIPNFLTFACKLSLFLFLTWSRRFALNPSEVGSKMEGVPIKETMLSDMCPDIESAFCFPHKYRTINGECNNVKNPTWGITGAAYLRILEPTYKDGECRSFIIICIRKCLNQRCCGPTQQLKLMKKVKLD